MTKFAVLALFASIQIASAETCSDLERSVFDLINEAQGFKTASSFQDFGWSANGPTHGWLDRWKEVRDQDNALHLQFLRKYDYMPGDLFTVYDAYRTDRLDSYYQDIEMAFFNGPNCTQ